MGTEGFVNLVNMHDSSSSDRMMSHPTVVVLIQPLVLLLQPPKAAPVVPHAPTPVAGCATAEASPPPTIPTAGQAIPLLTHTPVILG